MRADRLPRREREPLGLRQLAASDQKLREPALHLAERRPVLERLEHADRLAEVALRRLGVAAPPRHPAEVVERPGEQPRRSCLGEQRA